MSLRANLAETYTQDGKPTLALIRLLQDYERRLLEAEGKLAAIAAVTAPTGGSPVDSEARTAISEILAAA